MYHKLLLDHAREWYRTAKSVQENKIYAQDQMHPDRSRADRVQEQPIDRNRESRVSHPSIPNMARNYIEENSLENVSSDLVQLTVPRPDTYRQAAAASFDSKSEEREEITDVPTPALPVMERTEEQSTYTPGSRKSTRKNFGKPASSFSDFYM